MRVAELKSDAFKPFAGIALTKRYFGAVKSMDSGKGRSREKGVRAILDLWSKDGELRITGPEPIGDRRFASPAALREFYSNRTKGIDKVIDLNLSTVNVANAKSGDHVTVSGTRYVVNKDGEGMQVPFTHNFELEDGAIKRLHINIGKPTESAVAPLGTLRVQDMGRLAAMAWMVA